MDVYVRTHVHVYVDGEHTDPSSVFLRGKHSIEHGTFLVHVNVNVNVNVNVRRIP